MTAPPHENHKRSIAKATSWRVLATLTTIAIVFLLTGSLAISLGVGFVEVISKFILYYVHERAWNKVGWGKTLK